LQSLPLEDVAEMTELVARCLAISPVGELAHEGAVRFLVERLVCQDVFPPASELQSPKLKRSELGPPAGRPIFISLGRKELAAKLACCLDGNLRVAGNEGAIRECVEPVDVRHDGRGRPQLDEAATEGDGVPRSDGVTHVVGGLVQVRSGGGGQEVGPKRLEHLVPVEASIGRQGKEREQLPGSTGPPAIRNRMAVNGDLESAEQSNVEPRHGAVPWRCFRSRAFPDRTRGST
jgi:hypothetical protein